MRRGRRLRLGTSLGNPHTHSMSRQPLAGGDFATYRASRKPLSSASTLEEGVSADPFMSSLTVSGDFSEAPFTTGVPHVVRVASHEDVVRIGASRVVTPMTRMKPIGNRAENQFIRHAMTSDLFPIIHHDLRILGVRPKMRPTFIFGSNLQVLPQAIPYWPRGMRHTHPENGSVIEYRECMSFAMEN